jgi:hypothetical protein
VVYHVTNTKTKKDYALKVIKLHRCSHRLKYSKAEFEVCYIFFGFNIDLLCYQFRCNENCIMGTFCKP